MPKVSKNGNAELICGLREKHTPINEPWELDYFCPVCRGKKTLRFSEYNFFMYCPKCNIDIPSFLCLKANTKQAVAIYAARFLTFVAMLKKDARISGLSDGALGLLNKEDLGGK